MELLNSFLGQGIIAQIGEIVLRPLVLELVLDLEACVLC